MDQDQDQDQHLQPSILGTKGFWEENYQKELDNYMDHGDVGEVWFGQNNSLRIVNWVEKNVEKNAAILELGCGNGLLLFELAARKFLNLSGVDYVEEAIELSRNIARSRRISNVVFECCDILKDFKTSNRFANKFQVVIDKGTFDAICLTPDADLVQLRRSYLETVSKVLIAGGLFIIMSCNWTREELCSHFEKENLFKMIHQIETPSFQFGGKTGNQVTCLIFKSNC